MRQPIQGFKFFAYRCSDNVVLDASLVEFGQIKPSLRHCEQGCARLVIGNLSRQRQAVGRQAPVLPRSITRHAAVLTPPSTFCERGINATVPTARSVYTNKIMVVPCRRTGT
jgi:hypothetical protein